MDYSNPDIPDGINVSPRNPLSELAILLGGILFLLVFALILLSLASRTLAGQIPFSMEQKIAGHFISEIAGENATTPEYLQSLSDDLAHHMDMPEDMSVTLYLVDGEGLNAFAMLGGNIFVHQGLLDSINNENALAMVIAHEIAHVRERHPIVSLGQGVVIGLGLVALTGFSNDRLLADFIGYVGGLTLLGYSRDQEREADELALEAVFRKYGHIRGATDFFQHILEKDGMQLTDFTSTHPLTQERIDSMHQLARDKSWDINGDLTPLQSIE